METEYWVIPIVITNDITAAFGKKVSKIERPNKLWKFVKDDLYKIDKELHAAYFEYYAEDYKIHEKTLRLALNVGNVDWGIKIGEKSILLDVLCAFAYHKSRTVSLRWFEAALGAYDLTKENIYRRQKKEYSPEYHRILVETDCINIVIDQSAAQNPVEQLIDIVLPQEEVPLKEELKCPAEIEQETNHSAPTVGSQYKLSAVRKYWIFAISITTVLIFCGFGIWITAKPSSPIIEYYVDQHIKDTAVFHFRNSSTATPIDVNINFGSDVGHDRVLFRKRGRFVSPPWQDVMIFDPNHADEHVFNVIVEIMKPEVWYTFILPYDGTFESPILQASTSALAEIPTVKIK